MRPARNAFTAGWCSGAFAAPGSSDSLSSISVCTMGARSAQAGAAPGARGVRLDLVAVLHATRSDRLGQRVQHVERRVPADARVGDRNTVLKRLSRNEVLAS